MMESAVESTSEGSSHNEGSGEEAPVPAWNTAAPAHDLNLQFYQGKLVSEPHGVTVDEILSWFGDQYMLETHHGYIQWLFPTSQPSSSNRYAQPLRPEEAEAIQRDKAARRRYLNAYFMMLDFFGMTIVDLGTGALARTQHYKDRFVNLNYSTHNHIRITRILKSLGEMGLERYQFPLVKFLLVEAIWTGKLLNTIPSARDYWIEAVKDASERNILKEYAVKLAMEALDSVSPHPAKGKVPCDCQTCIALLELRKIAPNYQPKQQTQTQTVCNDPNCSCKNKIYLSNDRDHLAAQRVVQIEDLSHLTLELAKISAKLNVVVAERAVQKTIETADQIEELFCVMDELKEVSITMRTVSTKLEALSLGERMIQKKESEMAAKRLVGGSAAACAEKESCPAVEDPVPDPTVEKAGAKAHALPVDGEKRAVKFNLYSPQAPVGKVDRAHGPTAQLSSTAGENKALDGCSTVENPTSAAKGKLSKEKPKTSQEKNPKGIQKDPIIQMTDRLFSDFSPSINPPQSAQGGRKKNPDKPPRKLSPDLDDQGSEEMSFTSSGLEGSADPPAKLWTWAGADGGDDSTGQSQRPPASLPNSGKSLGAARGGRGGKKEEADLTKEVEADEEEEEDNHARPEDEDEESEDDAEEPSWMVDYRKRCAQGNVART